MKSQSTVSLAGDQPTGEHSVSLEGLLSLSGPAIEEELLPILEDYMTRVERGQVVDLESFVAQHPDHAETLRGCIQSIQFLNHMAPVQSGFPQIPDHVVECEIGRGGMGIVYRASQVSLGRQVAIKVLPAMLLSDARQVARFHLEAQAAARLQHPGIVPIYTVGCAGDLNYYTMRLIDGISLDQVVSGQRSVAKSGDTGHQVSTLGDGVRKQNQSLPPDDTKRFDSGTNPPLVNGATSATTSPAEIVGAIDATLPLLDQVPIETPLTDPGLTEVERQNVVAELMVQAARALDYAHDAGIVHRDVKPSNLLVDGTGTLWVTDFGLAHVQNDGSLTQSGALIGTLAYMSPEQLAGDTIDRRTDVYGLGLTMYEVLTGGRALMGSDRASLFRQHESAGAFSIRAKDKGLSQDLDMIVRKATERCPADRYSTIAEMGDDLQRFLDEKPILAKPPTVARRVTKFAQRHRAWVVAAASVFLMTTITSWGALFWISDQNVRLSLSNDDLVSSRLDGLNLVAAIGLSAAERLGASPESKSIRGEILNDSLSYYRSFAENFENDPRFRKHALVCQFRIGQICNALGELDQSVVAYKETVDRCNEFLNEDASASMQWGEGQVKTFGELKGMSLNNLALTLAEMGQPDAAIARYDEARQTLADTLDHLQKTAATSVDEDRCRQALEQVRFLLGKVQANAGVLFSQQGETDLAVSRYKDAEAQQSRLLEFAPDGQESVENVLAYATTLSNLAALHLPTDPATAKKHNADAADRLSRLDHGFDLEGGEHTSANLDERSSSLGVQQRLQVGRALAITFSNNAAIEAGEGQLKPAAANYFHAIRILKEMHRVYRSDRTRAEMAIVWNNLGRLYSRNGKLEPAENALTKSHEILSQLVALTPENQAYKDALGGVQHNLESLKGRLAAAQASGRSAPSLGDL
ncbi:MAG: serine/threonine-protein kinase [Planctomycetota bacterium]